MATVKEVLDMARPIVDKFIISDTPPPIEIGTPWINTENGKLYKWNGTEWEEQKSAE
jgi:hypothetical protein